MPIQNFIHSLLTTLCSSLPERDARNASFIWVTTLVAIPVMVSTAAFDNLHGEAELALAKIIAIWLCILNLALLHWRRDAALAGSVLLTILLGLMVADFYGGVTATGPSWFCVFPAAALFLKGLARGVLWSGAGIMLLLLLGVLAAVGLVPAPLTTAAVVLLALSLALLTLMLVVSHSILMAAETRLEERAAQLGREVLERLSVEQTLRRTEEKLRFMAHRDGLTGLPTRALLYDRIEQALAVAARTGEPLGLLLIDAGNFGSVNGRFGHSVGDQVLIAAAGRLREAVGATDSVARTGGDEFGVLVWNVEGAALRALRDRLWERLNAPYRIDGQPLSVGFNVACAGLTPGCDIESVFRCAEREVGSSPMGRRPALLA